MEQKGTRKILKRELAREALTRMEEAARTQEDYERIVKKWNDLDKNRERREKRRETGDPQTLFEVDFSDRAIIPPPLNQRLWRKLMRGDFLDVIFDCPYEIQELTSSRSIYELLKTLKDHQKEVLYFWVIRQWKPQRIAALRGQTDRNILKVYAAMMESLRYKLYMRLLPRYKAEAPLTLAQKEFVAANITKYGEGKPPRRRRTKAQIEEQKSRLYVDGGK